jgi:hypothetical protein
MITATTIQGLGTGDWGLAGAAGVNIRLKSVAVVKRVCASRVDADPVTPDGIM